jgi:RHS repeat-associated protein
MVCSHRQKIGPGFAARGLLSLVAEPQLAENSHQGSERDKSGRCIQKSAVSATINYLYSGSNVLNELDGSGNFIAAYTQGVGVDDPLAQLTSGTASYYEAYGLGSLTSLSNATGSLAKTYTYDSFGNLTASTGTLSNFFQYTARESDSETALYYYRARYYDPTIGRFVSQDPSGPSQGPNLYAYVYNSPTGSVDPSGLYSIDLHFQSAARGIRTAYDVEPLKRVYFILQGTESDSAI